MFRYIVKRIISIIPVIICITILLFVIVKMMPGDPVKHMLPHGLKPDVYKIAYDVMYKELGLDKSFPEQYVRWIAKMLQGDYGYSTRYSRPVNDVITEPLFNTLTLSALVIVMELAIVIPVGIKCATKRFSKFDNFWQVFSLITYSMPTFFVAICLIFVLGIKLKLFPLGGMPNGQLYSGFTYLGQWFRYALLPAITLTIVSIAGTIRYVRNSMIDALSQDYIRTARSKGLSEKVVIYSHAFRNALIPISTVIIAGIFAMFIGSPITESVFAWNGLGKLLFDSLNARDFYVVITVNTFFAIVSVMANFFADIVYGLVDPRVKLE